jgi:putative transposase
VLDDCTRECLAFVADTSLSDPRVAREFDDIMRRRGRRMTIVSDNGTEFTSSDPCLGGPDRYQLALHRA